MHWTTSTPRAKYEIELSKKTIGSACDQDIRESRLAEQELNSQQKFFFSFWGCHVLKDLKQKSELCKFR